MHEVVLDDGLVHYKDRGLAKPLEYNADIRTDDSEGQAKPQIKAVPALQKCSLCQLKTNQEMATCLIEYLKINIKQEITSVPLVLPIPESIGKDDVLVCNSCFQKNKIKYDLMEQIGLSDGRVEIACQTEKSMVLSSGSFVSLLPKLATTASITDTTNSSSIVTNATNTTNTTNTANATDITNGTAKTATTAITAAAITCTKTTAMKRPYPGSTLPSHVITSAIRNSPVRATHNVLMQLNRTSDSPFLKRLKSD